MNNKSLKIIIIVLTILTIGLTGYIIYDNITEKELSNVNNHTNNNDEQEKEQNDSIEKDENKDSNNNNREDNESATNEKYTYKDYIRDDTLILYPASCLGNGPLISYINKDKNIVISGSGGNFVQSDGSTEVIQINKIVKSANAKYLYKVGIISCDSIYLYYINNNNELYLIDIQSIHNDTNILSKGTKITNSKVVEFLGEETKEYERYLKVLLEDGTVEYIKYFEVAEELR